MHGLKALGLVKQNCEVATDAMMTYSELDAKLAARGTSRSGGTIGKTGTFQCVLDVRPTRKEHDQVSLSS